MCCQRARANQQRGLSLRWEVRNEVGGARAFWEQPAQPAPAPAGDTSSGSGSGGGSNTPCTASGCTPQGGKKRSHKGGKFSESVCDSVVCLVQCHFEGAVAQQGPTGVLNSPRGRSLSAPVPHGIVLLFLCPVWRGLLSSWQLKKRKLAGSGFIPAFVSGRYQTTE